MSIKISLAPGGARAYLEALLEDARREEREAASESVIEKLRRSTYVLIVEQLLGCCNSDAFFSEVQAAQVEKSASLLAREEDFERVSRTDRQMRLLALATFINSCRG